MPRRPHVRGSIRLDSDGLGAAGPQDLPVPMAAPNPFLRMKVADEASPLVRVLATLRGRAQDRSCTSYYAARNNGYTVRRAASFAGKALALAQDVTQGLGPPRGPYREGRTAAPRRALPRTVRSRLECRLFYAPHSNWVSLFPLTIHGGRVGFFAGGGPWSPQRNKTNGK
jgi:hypothetical protein